MCFEKTVKSMSVKVTDGAGGSLSGMHRSKRKDGNDSCTGGNPPMSEGLLTVQQVAENWQVSQRMIRRMIADGRLPIVRLGRAVRIRAKPGRTTSF